MRSLNDYLSLSLELMHALNNFLYIQYKEGVDRLSLEPMETLNDFLYIQYNAVNKQIYLEPIQALNYSL